MKPELTKTQQKSIKAWHPSLRPMVVAMYVRSNERIKAAGKHKCQFVKCGSVRKLTGANSKVLKRPVLVAQFWECKLCGREKK